MITLLNASIKVGKDEEWSKDKTYAYNGGFITYRYGDTIYVIKESTAVTKLLEEEGFVKNLNAFAQTINSEDFGRFLLQEGPEGPNVRKLAAYIYDRDFRKNWESLTNPEELQNYIKDLLENSPYFQTKGTNFLGTEWGEYALSQYNLKK